MLICYTSITFTLMEDLPAELTPTAETPPRLRMPFAIALTLVALFALTDVVAHEFLSFDALDAFMPATVSYGTDITFTHVTPKLNIAAYNKKMIELAGFGTTTEATGISATSTAWTATTTSIASLLHKWPVSTVYPNVGALLPWNRIVAYYGNFYSAQMGILGEFDQATVIQKLQTEIVNWKTADPDTNIIPGIDYIAVVAQGYPGTDGKYRLRMPADQIQKAIDLARSMNGVVFLDVQPGLSTLADEIPLLESYLSQPDVHLAIDPEFSMKFGNRPGTVIGTMNADDVNYAVTYLADLVKRYNLPPKILVVHRFTGNMVVNAKNIVPLPEVQIVVNMDGWGPMDRKEGTYMQVVTQDPVQFSGIKLFYKNDMKVPSTGLLTPSQVLSLHPAPSFVEYQ